LILTEHPKSFDYHTLRSVCQRFDDHNTVFKADTQNINDCKKTHIKCWIV